MTLIFYFVAVLFVVFVTKCAGMIRFNHLIIIVHTLLTIHILNKRSLLFSGKESDWYDCGLNKRIKLFLFLCSGDQLGFATQYTTA